MSKKLLIAIILFVGLVTVLCLEYFMICRYVCPIYVEEEAEGEQASPKAMMLLIEFINTDGLVNMVSDMEERDISGLLLVNADFVEKNVYVIKEILKAGNIEVVASYDPKPFWEMSYDEQYEVITDMVERIDDILGTNVRVIGSRYMASDQNTVEIADDLGIEYVLARGTTELATTVYKPEEYDVKIISVSNIDVPEFKYGSFCDYSFYERSGSPEDMTREYERAIQENKFIGVSHTYIGGYKARWNDMWHNFWDDYDVDWVDLDVLGTVDKYMPMWQIPINKNAPYTPEKIRPLIPYDEEENVTNPCEVEELNPSDANLNGGGNLESDTDVVVFHNNTGPMCVEALAFFEENGIDYEEHLTSDIDFSELLEDYKEETPVSEGVSENFGYYPMIFVGGRAFSGFSDEIGDEIIELVEE